MHPTRVLFWPFGCVVVLCYRRDFTFGATSVPSVSVFLLGGNKIADTEFFADIPKLDRLSIQYDGAKRHD
ncbi:MAG: hypothetical protein OXE94_01800 [Aestuariivita sp.]|nr:hypothetical protein [Aestuariivita sp.]MCY4203772.1 hypothetical protein [Aestuariivita sp.]